MGHYRRHREGELAVHLEGRFVGFQKSPYHGVRREEKRGKGKEGEVGVRCRSVPYPPTSFPKEIATSEFFEKTLCAMEKGEGGKREEKRVKKFRRSIACLHFRFLDGGYQCYHPTPRKRML